MTPALSVLIPFKNSLPYLEECITSVQKSLLEEIEILLVDDFSTDGSRELAEGFARQDTRIHLFSQKVPGLIPALNAGLKKAAAPFIARMDSDDIALPERFLLQLNELKNSPQISLTSSTVECFGENPMTAGFMKYIDWVNRCITSVEIAEGLLIESSLVHPSVCFRADKVRQLGGYREYPGPEDYDLWIRMKQAGCEFSKLPLPLVQWRIHATSFSRTDIRYSESCFERRKFAHLKWSLLQELSPHRKIVVFGAGKNGGRLGRYLLKEGFDIEAFADIDPAKAVAPVTDYLFCPRKRYFSNTQTPFT